MQRFIIEKTAAYYFSNLVWLMRNHVLDLDLCVKNTTDHTKRCRLTDLIDEYIDHFNYLQDIYMINNPDLSTCLTEELIRRLLIPVCLNSISKKDKYAKVTALKLKSIPKSIIPKIRLNCFILVHDYLNLNI